MKTSTVTISEEFFAYEKDRVILKRSLVKDNYYLGTLNELYLLNSRGELEHTYVSVPFIGNNSVYDSEIYALTEGFDFSTEEAEYILKIKNDSFIGKKFKHFKGNTYKVLCIAKDSDSLKKKIVYQSLVNENDIYVRDLEEFKEVIVRDFKLIKRFVEIKE